MAGKGWLCIGASAGRWISNLESWIDIQSYWGNPVDSIFQPHFSFWLHVVVENLLETDNVYSSWKLFDFLWKPNFLWISLSMLLFIWLVVVQNVALLFYAWVSLSSFFFCWMVVPFVLLALHYWFCVLNPFSLSLCVLLLEGEWCSVAGHFCL